MKIRQFTPADTDQAASIWNTVVTDGVAFPQTDTLGHDEALRFFESQTYTAVAEDDATGQILGLYILHPNNVGRCGHICNTSYAVRTDCRGLHIGEQLVRHSLATGARFGFRIMQFNAVVASNHHALHLYERLGFHRLGIIPQGFRMPDGQYEDIVPHYISLL